jgi:hypothetical protein
MAENPGLPEIRGFRNLKPFHANAHEREAFRSTPAQRMINCLAGSSFEQVLILPCMRTEDAMKMTDTTGNRGYSLNAGFQHTHERDSFRIAQEPRVMYLLARIIFGAGFNLYLLANRGRNG